MLLQEPPQCILLTGQPADAVLVDLIFLANFLLAYFNLIYLKQALKPSTCLLDAPEQLQLGVQLAVAGHDVLVLVLVQLPRHSLLGHPELVLDLVEGGVGQVATLGGLLVAPHVIAGSAVAPPPSSSLASHTCWLMAHLKVQYTTHHYSQISSF